ncbi:hypothetical protein CEXT_223811 [Caerostris extrusa]|uniref:Uncharacterized protein n=1 Tax=Caerostris extrusa TaxID=172846 RepID=A0AAV4XUU4_CAEEX|nr:hypothetical protein CEXT_223811 [Caerostris extrusa]
MLPVGPLFPAMILATLLVTTHLHPISRPPRDDYQTFQTEILPSGSADDNVFRTLVEGNHQLQEQHFHYLGTPERNPGKRESLLASLGPGPVSMSNPVRIPETSSTPTYAVTLDVLGTALTDPGPSGGVRIYI